MATNTKDPLGFGKLQEGQDQNDQQDADFLDSVFLKRDLGATLSEADTARLDSLLSDPTRFRRLADVVDKRRTTPDPNNPNTNPSNILNGLSSTNSSVNQTRNSVTNQQTTKTQFVDLPTPEEFLDNFSNSYNIHITGLVQSGAIRPEVAEFARGFEQQVFGEYLRQQTSNLLAGKPIFKVTGMNPANDKLLGARNGGSQQQKSQSEFNQNTSTKTTGVDGTGAGASTTGAGQAVDSADNTSFHQTDNQEQNDQSTEAVVQRENLTAVHTLAPLDFMKDAATAQRLNLLYAANKGLTGIGGREAQTRSGAEVSRARRV